MKELLQKTIRSFLLPALALSLGAALGTAGTITGRVINPTTGEYVRNAKVEIKETGQVVYSGNGGEYRVPAVAAGTVTLVVTYTGYHVEPATVEVAADGTATRDFEIVSTGADAGQTITLDRFVVSSAREGNAKAIMEQRSSMNVTNTVATDAYGDNPEGNVSEFLRFIPGVFLDSNYGEGRYVNMRGLGSAYTSVTMDGVSMASTDASNTGGSANGRSFSFEQAAISSLDSVEVSKTISADTDANAPAGTINLRSKRAFDRKGRRVAVAVNSSFHSSAFTLGKTNGPTYGGPSRKFRPGGSLDFSDIYFGGRLGLVLSVSESNIYEQTDITTLAYNRTPTALDLRPEVLSSIAVSSNPRLYERSAVSLTADFRATPSLSVGVNVSYNESDLYTPQRTVTFTTGTRTAVIGDGLTSLTTNATNAGISISGNNHVRKLGESLMISPSFEWKRGELTVDGRLSMSKAQSWYNNLDKGTLYSPSALAVTGTNFRAVRSSAMASDWQITQTSGADISQPATFPSNAVIIAEDGRSSKQKFYTGQVNATLPTVLGVPITWKAGLKRTFQSRTYDNIRDLTRYNYIGGGSYWTDKVSDFLYDTSVSDVAIRSLSGQRIFMPNMALAYDDFKANPALYRQTFTAAFAYNAWVANHQRFAEEIDAGYFMGTAQLNRRASLRAGLRWEKTTNIAKQPNSYTTKEVQAAGYAVNAATGQAATVEGIFYQFMSRPWEERVTSFDNFFPSASLKYELPWNLDLSLGFSTTIRRAPYSSLSGVMLVNDESQIVTITNPGLQPESARNYALRLARYFEPIGILAVSVYENRVTEKFLETTVTAQQFGNTDPALDNYQFTTTVNSADQVKIRSVEVEFSQNLGFLSKHLDRFTVVGSYTQSNAANITLFGLTPRIANGGINYTFGPRQRFNVNFNANWVDDTPRSETTWDRHRVHANAGASVKLTRWLMFSASARNVLNEPRIVMQQVGTGSSQLLTLERNGVTATFAFKATF